jgi:hypothetical protein
MGNVLIELIQSGKILTVDELRSAYRAVVMKTHPDAAGSARYLESYLALNDSYAEVKCFLARLRTAQRNAAEVLAPNHRLSFFQQLHLIESLEMPYASHPEEHAGELFVARRKAREEIAGWRSDLSELYPSADTEYVRLKSGKPRGPYLRHALALNVRPLVHDVVLFHLSAHELYAKQARQNVSGIMHQLSENGCPALRLFLSLLLSDMENGPAALE